MDRPAIVIRDREHHYGDDLTVPEATARLCDGGQVTVSPALGRQPELPPEISWDARTFETPAVTALFAEALALASQLAGCTELGGGQTALSRAAAIGAAHGRDAVERRGGFPWVWPVASLAVPTCDAAAACWSAAAPCR